MKLADHPTKHAVRLLVDAGLVVMLFTVFMVPLTSVGIMWTKTKEQVAYEKAIYDLAVQKLSYENMQKALPMVAGTSTDRQLETTEATESTK